MENELIVKSKFYKNKLTYDSIIGVGIVLIVTMVSIVSTMIEGYGTRYPFLRYLVPL